MDRMEASPPDDMQPLRKGAMLLWYAYDYLRASDLQSVSGTARLLKSPDLDYLGSRLAAELLELAGVLTGEHRHTRPEEDLVLEGSQVCYWTYLCALALDFSFDEIDPADELAGPQDAERSSLVGEIRALARCTRGLAVLARKEDQVRVLKQALRGVGAGCAVLGVQVVEIVRYDLSQMSARDYMQPYFEASGKG